MQALAQDPDLFSAASAFFEVLGYKSDRLGPADPSGPEEFLSSEQSTQAERFFIKNVQTVKILFQITDEEVTNTAQMSLLGVKELEEGNIESFLFVAADLRNPSYSRGKYAEMTREISKRFSMPVFVLFRSSDFISLAFADRRPSRKPGQKGREVLEKVSLLQEINCSKVHAGHLNILTALSLNDRIEWIKTKKEKVSFDSLHQALLGELDTRELTKRFYQELSDWFDWAVQEAKFPLAKDANQENHLIRLITRMLFVWFIKEKNLVSEELFDEEVISDLLKNFGDGNGNYYRAILQNLFFATLNTKIKKRNFSSESEKTYRNFNLYRYADLIQDQERFLSLMEKTPFINGGLFDCLDSEEGVGSGGYRVDCFTDNKAQRKDLLVPDKLFFHQERGLLPLFQRYKFTVEESTPIEQEVALDPELLGKVFENLLAAYNSETRKTARKQTGSYYTPRAVVDYMVDESLLAYLGGKVKPSDRDSKFWQDRLRYLLDYADAFNDAADLFDPQERQDLVQAIADIKVLDPAVGSGAFPMGVLHKLVLILSRLDGDNKLLTKVQKIQAIPETDTAYEDQDSLAAFGRKLFLIQNSIFGVDIQPIACQIAKLRFFISLAIEQQVNDDSNSNYGIKPLPNLETRFVAANTLLDIGAKGETRTIVSPEVTKIEKELGNIRKAHFNESTRDKKIILTNQFKAKQKMLSDELKRLGFEDNTANKIANWDLFDQNSTADWFDSEWMFGEKDGFDIVISNPPYINVGELSEEMRQYLFSKYATCEKRTDIYIAFIEKSLSLINAGGALTFIIPASFGNQKYGEKLRSLLINNYYIEEIVDASNFRIFDATVFNIIIRISKSKRTGKTKIRNYSEIPNLIKREGHSFTVKQKRFEKMKDKRFETRKHVFMTLPIKNKIWENSRPLQDICYIAYGARLNHKTKKIGKAEYISENYMPGLKPFIEGRDIQRYSFTSSKWLNYKPRSHYNPMFPALFESDKLMLINIVTKRLRFAYDDKGYYNSHTVVNCVKLDLLINESYRPLVPIIRKSKISFAEKFDYKFLLAILNSSLMNWYFLSFISESLHCYPEDVKDLPIPNISKSKQSPLIRLVDQIIVTKQNPKYASGDASGLEQQIDNLVYELYDLTKKEIKAIQQGIDKIQK